MDLLEHIVFVIGLGASRLLEPAMVQLDHFHLFLRQQLTALHVFYEWQGTVITLGWAIALFLVFRTLRGVVRIVFVLGVALVLAKAYGMLPPA